MTSVRPLFNKILFATDFSDCSQAAAPYARAIAKLCGATVHILHVCDIEAPGEMIPSIDVEDEAELRRKIQALASSAAFEGVPHKELVRAGAVCDVVLDVARELNIDLVVVGTHGEHGLKQFILGSTAEEILRNAQCAVLSVGPESRKRIDEAAEILYPTDFSSQSELAFPYALNLARESNARLTLLHAVDPDEVAAEKLDEAVADANKRLSHLVHDHPDVRAQINVERGSAAETILSKAKQIGAGFVVMGAHGGAVAAHLPWKVVRQVVCHAECPVLSFGGR